MLRVPALLQHGRLSVTVTTIFLAVFLTVLIKSAVDGLSCARLAALNETVALRDAARRGCPNLVGKLMERHVGGFTDEDWLDTIESACASGNTETVRVLAAKSELSTAKRKINGDTALHVCARTGCAGCCAKLLLIVGYDRTAVNAEYKTAAEVAANTKTFSAIEDFCVGQ